MPYRNWCARRTVLTAALVGQAIFGFSIAADAHPHVWATVRSEVVFGPGHKITGIRHAWTFDEFYSAMAVQGLDTNADGTYAKDELEPLAQVNVESLKDFDYFTFVRRDGEEDFLPLKGPEDYWVEYDGTVLTLHFTLPLETPLDPGSTKVTVDVYDPSFFVAFGFAEKAAVKLAGSAPGCAAKVAEADPEAAEEAKALTESFFSQLGPTSNYGSQFAQTVTVTCGAQ
ncbi:hypothetical protein AUC68_04280 [Methyloceanibacter methanicus]|uniref:ABC transporter substrate-binding protein n=1 Tax=Methyloceanibacter methanicus TaxID=1774968 RepID=A0A1E3W140_9HYPH|nr:DUF1007 family protein [Methyloceanibacter methanicus]ODR99231.1 hypothetical protein AUC68_04280 [Methyloceanibacter methanicus]